MTRPEKMSRIPLIHIKGNAVGSWIGMPKAVEAPTGLSMKLMPIAMIAIGTKRVHQNSGELFLNVGASIPVVMFISLSSPVPRHLGGKLVKGMPHAFLFNPRALRQHDKRRRSKCANAEPGILSKLRCLNLLG